MKRRAVYQGMIAVVNDPDISHTGIFADVVEAFANDDDPIP